MKQKIFVNFAILALVTSCASPRIPKGPFPRMYRTQADLRLFRENTNRGTTYWLDTAQWHFLPGNQRCAEVALIPHGHSINVIRVWSPVEFLPPGDFKMRFQIHFKSGKNLDIDMWMTTDKFQQYFAYL